MLAAAQWLETRLKTAGLEVSVLKSHTDTGTSILDVIFHLFCPGLIPHNVEHQHCKVALGQDSAILG